ncbi:MAG: FkbM family methyltransferase [Chloroflexota bacterium]
MSNSTSLPFWRRLLLRSFAWMRRKTRITYGTKIVHLIYPSHLRKKQGITEEITYLDRFKLHLNTQSHIEWHLFINGVYEPHIHKVFRKNITKGDTVMDIGANIGVHTLYLSQLVGHEGKVISLEPFPPVLEKLNANLSRNNIENVTVESVAASDTPSERPMVNVYSNNEGTASLWHEEANGIRHVVSVTTIDEIVEKHQLTSLKLIKMDIQGSEALALKGAQNTLRNFRPVIIFEYDESWQVANVSLDSVINSLGEIGYQLWGINQNGEIEAFDYASHHELIALPQVEN